MHRQQHYSRQHDLSCPVIISGLGGSGTRLVASVLARAGIYLGDYHNPELDSGFFGKLIGRNTYLRERSSSSEAIRRLNIFAKLHVGRLLTPTECVSMFRFVDKKLRQSWLLYRRAYGGKKNITYGGWGFKHPFAMYYLSQLINAFPNMRYVHVIRHGLDMAFTSNNEILQWADTFDIDSRVITASERLDFWIRANTWAIELCKELLPNRFFVVNFDRLCAEPVIEIQRLFEYLDIEPRVNISEIAEIVKVPLTVGRYKLHLDQFSHDQIECVASFGFDVN